MCFYLLCLEGSNEDTLFKLVSNYPSDSGQCSVAGDGFAFTVRHDIVLHYLGIQSTALAYSNSSIVRVILVDSTSHEKIASATFHQSAHLSSGLYLTIYDIIIF